MGTSLNKHLVAESTFSNMTYFDIIHFQWIISKYILQKECYPLAVESNDLLD